MIKSDNGSVEIEGKLSEVLAEVSSLVHNMHGVFVNELDMSPDEARDCILEAVNLGFKSKEEMTERVIGALSGLKDLIEQLLKEEKE